MLKRLLLAIFAIQITSAKAELNNIIPPLIMAEETFPKDVPVNTMPPLQMLTNSQQPRDLENNQTSEKVLKVLIKTLDPTYISRILSNTSASNLEQKNNINKALIKAFIPYIEPISMPYILAVVEQQIEYMKNDLATTSSIALAANKAAPMQDHIREPTTIHELVHGIAPIEKNYSPILENNSKMYSYVSAEDPNCYSPILAEEFIDYSPCFAENPNLQHVFNERALFEKAFGHVPDLSSDKPLEFDFFIEEEKLGKIYAELKSPLEHSIIEFKSLITFLEPILLPNFIELLKQKEKEVVNGYIALEKINQLGLNVVLDNEAFIIKLVIPAKMKKTRTITLKGNYDYFGDLPKVQPAPITAFLNARAADDYMVKSRDVNAAEKKRRPIHANLDGAVNIHDYVLEGNGTFTERDPTAKWKIGDVRIIHDINALGIRLTAGDLKYETTTFQSVQKLGGLTVANNFRAKGIRNSSPSGKSEFVLEQPSQVEIFVNEQLVATRHLSAGRYDIKDFPLTSGVNDVRVVITDPVGRKEELYFPFFYNFQLLAPGLHNYSYSIGMPSTNVNNTKKYNTKQMTFSGFHRLGITDSFTGGVNFQYDKFQYIAGIDGLWETKFGTLQPELATSRIHNKESGQTATIQYTKGWQAHVLAIRLATMSKYFAPLGTLTPNNLGRYEIAARYNFPLFWNFYAGISTSYQLNPVFNERSHSHMLSLNKQLIPGLSFGCSMTQKKQFHRPLDHIYMAHINFMVPRSRSSLNLDYNSQQDNTALEWDYSPASPVQSLGSNIRMESSPKEQDKLSSTITYNFNRLETSLSYNTKSDHKQYNLYEQQAKLQIGTGLAFANGYCALTRPVTNSFVIVAPTKKLKNHPIDIEPVGDDVYETQANWWGPGVVPSLSEYQDRIISIDDSDFPIGQELDGNTFAISSKYKTGTLITIGSDNNILLQGRLLDKDNNPIPKLTLALLPKDSNSTENIKEDELFFTGKHGFFSKQGVKPGEYKLVLFNLSETTIPIKIPEDKEGIFNLGTITAPTKYEQQL